MRTKYLALISLLALSLTIGPARGQDSSGGATAAAPDSSGGTPAPTANPLEGLFTPQPQFPTPQSQANPTPVVQGSNPIGGLFNAQPQYPTPQTQTNPTVTTPNGSNPLQGFFTGQPQFVTPQTQMNKDPVPMKEGPYGTEAKPAGDAQKESAAGEGKGEAAKAGADKDKEEKTADKDKDKDKDKEKEAKGKDKEKKEKAEKEEKEKQPVVYNPVTEAIVLLNSGRPAEALHRIITVMHEHPGNAQAHYVAAVIQVELRNYQAAINEYQSVLRLVPMTPLAARAAEGLKKLGGSPPDVKMPPLRTVR